MMVETVNEDDSGEDLPRATTTEREEQRDEMKSLPDLVDRILEEESESDSDDSDYHKYCTPTKSKQIPAIINLFTVSFGW